MGGMESTSQGVQRTDKDSTEQTWGDNIRTVGSNVFRIGILNIGGLSTERNSGKTEELQVYLTKLRLSVVGLNECNAHWKMVPTQYCLPERTRGWWECMHINTAYFESYQSLSKHQAGGVSL